MNQDVELTFVTDPSEIKELLDDDLTGLPLAVIENSYLKMPVRFVIRGRNVLVPDRSPSLGWRVGPDGSSSPSESTEGASNDTRRLPVLAFATALRAGIQRVETDLVATASVPEGDSIRFERENERVLVTAEGGELLVAGFEDLGWAIRRFHDDLVDMVKREVEPTSAKIELRVWFESAQ